MSSGLAPVEAVAFSPDGATVAAGSSDGTVQLWDATTQNEVGTTMTAGPAAIKALAFSPGGKVLAAGGEDGDVRLWDTATQSSAGRDHGDRSPGRGPDVQRERNDAGHGGRQRKHRAVVRPPPRSRPVPRSRRRARPG